MRLSTFLLTLFLVLLMLSNVSGAQSIYTESTSTDPHLTWSESILVNDGNSLAWAPSMAVDANGNIVVAWDDARNERSDIYFSQLSAGDLNWSANLKVSDIPYEDGHGAGPPAIAIGPDGSIHVVWEDNRDYDLYGVDIFYSQLLESGIGWSPSVRVNDAIPASSAMGAIGVKIVVDSNSTIYVFWHDDRNSPCRMYYSYSTDNGASWSLNTPWTDYEPQGDSFVDCDNMPVLAADKAGNIYALWNHHRSQNGDNAQFTVHSAKLNGGTIVAGSKLLVRDNTAGVRELASDIEVDIQGNLYAVLHLDVSNDSNSPQGIYLTELPSGSSSWQGHARIDDTSPSHAREPSITVDTSGNVYAVWRDGRNASAPQDTDIYSSYRPADTYGHNQQTSWVLSTRLPLYGVP